MKGPLFGGAKFLGVRRGFEACGPLPEGSGAAGLEKEREMGRVFGTDGARGVANTEISCELALELGRAAAMVAARDLGGRKPRFLVGRDTRLSSPMLEGAIAAGLCSAGADAVLLGVVPTPAVAYLTAREADGGIMLSASHNSFEFNGIKIFDRNGLKLSDEKEFEIEEIVLDHTVPYDLKWGDHVGTISHAPGLVDAYLEHLLSTVKGPFPAGKRILVDCANGSASATAPLLFERLGLQADFVGCEPDGTNINLNCGSTHIDRLGRLVLEGGYDMGFAFDGDADRFLAVDETGTLVDGDRLIAIFAKDLKEKGRLKNNSAVVTVMSNLGFFRFAREEGIEISVTKVGDRYVLENMLATGNVIGGEQSGHVIFFEHMPTGDGQLSALQLLDILGRKGLSLSKAASVMTVYPQVLVNVRADKEMKRLLDTDEGVRRAVEGYEQELGDEGRILIRPS